MFHTPVTKTSTMKKLSVLLALSFCLFAQSVFAGGQKPRKMVRVFIGTYTDGDSQGIYRFDMDRGSGKATEPVLAGKATNPGFIEIHPSGNYLYSTGLSGLSDDGTGTAVTAFSIDSTGNLQAINTQPSKGQAACHLTVDPQGKNLLVAHYSSGTTSVLPIRGDGGLDPVSSIATHDEPGTNVNPSRQDAPHPHSVNVDVAGRFAFVADLGIDKVMIYKLDAQQGTLAPAATPFVKLEPGGGPRHFHMHPNGKFAYANNELTNTLAALAFDAETGALTETESISTLPEDFNGANTTAEVRVHPNGRFVYVSNRGHESIAIFRIDSATGKLTAAGHAPVLGVQPRNFNIDPSGRFMIVVNQETENVVLFWIDSNTGGLTPTGQEFQIPTPVCVRFVEL